MAWIYAVRKGHAPGIYHDVESYQKALDGFSGAEGRRFQDEEAARRYLAGETPTRKGIYAVRRGRVPGIYHSAAECEEQVRGFNGAESQRFSNMEDAKRYMMGGKTPRRNVVRAPQKVPHSVRGRTAHHPGSRSQLVPEGRTGPGAPIKIYTDGGCLVHEDGAGGYAAVICLPNGNRKELSGGVDMTNSSRMELLAAVAALRTLESVAKIGASVELYTDSQYLYQGVTSRIWQTSKNQVETLLNKDLWIELSNLVEAYEIEWFWVKGHNGNLMNERCDWLATAAAKRTVAEKKWVPDFAKQLETAKNRIKELERINKKLTSDADRFHLLKEGKLSTADKDLFHAVYHESLTGFVRWKLRRWFTKQRH